MTKFILSIDGGGIRGVGPARILTHLQAQLEAAGGRPVCDAFDMFVGTSTGCIIAAGLAASGQIPMGQVGPDQILNLYYERGREMFVRSLLGTLTLDILQARYKTSAKNAVLKQIFGDLRLGQLKRNFLGTFYSLSPQPGAVFAQGGEAYHAGGRSNAGYDELLLSDVVNASSNAPMYFDPWPVGDGRFFGVDGGIFANDPAVCAYVEGRKMFPGEPLVVVSVGCGSKRTQFPRWKTWGLLRWGWPLNGVPLLEAIFDAQARTIDHQMQHLVGGGVSYFRLQYDLDSVRAAIDDLSLANLDAIKAAADAYVLQPDTAAQMAKIVALLTAGAKTPVTPGPRRSGAARAGSRPKAPQA